MSLNSVVMPVSPERVFEYLLDPDTYPRWLIGAETMRAVDDDWPAPGSRFHHRVGMWPVRIEDYSEIVELDPPRMLHLSVRASPIIRADVTFRCRGDDRESILIIEEEPVYRSLGNLARPVLDPATHVRNHGSLRKLRDIILEDAGTPST